MNKIYIKRLTPTPTAIQYFFIIITGMLLSGNIVSAQEIFPGGGTGSYNLTEPTGTGVAWNYGKIGIGNEVYARPGTTYPGPFQTNNWWNSAFWNLSPNQLQVMTNNSTELNSSHDMFPLPLMVKELTDGISFGYRTLEQQSEQPADWPGKNVSLEMAGYDLTMYCYANPTDNRGEASTKSVVDDYGDWHVKLGQSMGTTKVSTTIAKGNPFVFFEFNGPGTPVFGPGNGGQNKIVAVYKNAILVSIYAGGNNGNPKVSTVNPEGFYAFYFPAGTKISGNDNNFKDISLVNIGDALSPLKIKLPAGKTQFTMSVMPNGNASTLELYEPHAYCAITDTRFTYTYDPVKARVTNVFTVTTQAYDGKSNTPGTINTLFRHQYIFPPASGLVNTNPSLAYYGPRGTMKILEGNSFSTSMYYNGSLPQLGEAQRSLNTTFVNAELNYIANHRFIANAFTDHVLDHDDYASFKLAAQACRAAEIANQIDNPAARDRLIAAAKVIIEAFLTSPDGDRVSTVYSSKLNFMTTFPNSFQAYAGMYDYHFVVGHLIYACAEVGQFESKRTGNKNWVNQWKPLVDLLIRSTNDWNRDMVKPADPNQPWFPYLRFFDPYAGHSWWSNSCVGQEAINESVQFAQAAFMWGELTDNKPMRDMGAMLYTTESEAGKQYWFDYDKATMGAPFAPDYTYGHTGYLRESGYLYQTAASGVSISPIYNPKINSPEQIHGVTLMPFGAGSSLWMGFPLNKAQDQHQDFLAQQPGGYIMDNEGENASHVNSFLAFSNPTLSRQVYQNEFMPVNPKEGAEFHLVRMLPYHFITTLDSVGRVDTIRGDIPFFSTFVKDTCDTWLRHYMMYNSPGTGPDHEARTVHFTDGTCWWLPKDTLITYKLMGPDSLRKITAGPDVCVNAPISISVDARICSPRNPSMYYEYSTDNRLTWKILYDIKTASDSLTITFNPTIAGTYHFRAIMRGEMVPGLMCPLQDTSDNVATVTVNSCCPLTLDNATPTPVTCNKGSNGKIVIEAGNGAPAYQYSIDDGVTLSSNNTFTDLKAGTYKAYVKDANNCERRLDVIITEPTAIVVTAKDSTNNKCFGDKTGRAKITVSGGVSPYLYQWDDASVQTADSAVNLYSGTYQVRVTDQNSCTLDVSYQISEPEQLNITAIDITNVDCFGNATGALKANVTGGTVPYTYLWSSTATNAATITGLPSGNYTIKVTDKNGCIAQSAADVNTPAKLAVTIDAVQIKCFGETSGTLTATVTGGRAIYAYQWDVAGSANVASLSNLGSGNYNLTVTDNNLCTASASSTISAPDQLKINTLTKNNESCPDLNDGSITVDATGGTGTLNYSVDGISYNSSPVITNLQAKNYTVYVRDANSCSASDTISITEPTPMDTTFSSVPAICNNNNGSLTVIVTGGTPSYSYTWNDALSQTTATATNLKPGLYAVTVTDNSGCSQTFTKGLVSTPPTIVASIGSDKSICKGDSAALTFSIAGGNAPYDFTYLAGTVNTTLSGINNGHIVYVSPANTTIYSVTGVADANGCFAAPVSKVTITATPDPVVTLSSAPNDTICPSTAAILDAGSGFDSYLWSESETSQTVSKTIANSYWVEVTKNGCKGRDTINLTVLKPLVMSDSSMLCSADKATYSVTFKISDGDPLSYKVSGLNGTFSGNIFTSVPIPSGTAFNLIVTDNFNCNPIVYTGKRSCSCPSLATIGTDKTICKGDSAALTFTAGNGLAPYELIYSNGVVNDTLRGIINTYVKYVQPASTTDYSLIAITDASGCSQPVSGKATITKVPVYTLQKGSFPATCFGACDGIARVTPIGGLPPFTYLWSGGETSATLNGVCAGIYSVEVKDNKGCKDTTSFIIAEPAGIVYSTSFTNASCGKADGTATVTVSSGGNPPYNYLWDSGAANQTTATAINLSAGWYGFKMTDGSGCTKNDSIDVKNLNGVTFMPSSTSTDPSCHAKCDGTAIGVAQNGARPYTFTWTSSALTDSSRTNLCAGTYQLIVTDKNKCTDSKTFVLKDPDAPSASFTFPEQSSPFEPTLHFSNWSANATAYKWTFGTGDSADALNPSYTFPDSGYYNVCLRATNAANCYTDTCTKVYIKGAATFYIPNAFTPSKDDLNEYFMPVSIGLDPTFYQFEIFNRWGELFFSTSDITVGWDGTFEGRQVQNDVYVWKISAREKSSRKKFYKNGAVTVIK